MRVVTRQLCAPRNRSIAQAGGRICGVRPGQRGRGLAGAVQLRRPRTLACRKVRPPRAGAAWHRIQRARPFVIGRGVQHGNVSDPWSHPPGCRFETMLWKLELACADAQTRVRPNTGRPKGCAQASCALWKAGALQASVRLSLTRYPTRLGAQSLADMHAVAAERSLPPPSYADKVRACRTCIWRHACALGLLLHTFTRWL
jgi:hypothetical protein